MQQCGVFRGTLHPRRYTTVGALALILVLATLLDGFGLWRDGYPNPYYAVAVRSMLTSWHNFLFVAFDPVGFLSIDKPPLGLWIQVASAKAFGFHAWSIVLPQALAGIAAVYVLYRLVAGWFGQPAGLLAALALALTPISVAAARNNTMDSVLALAMLLAVWAAQRAIESGRLRWLLVCAAFLGLAFNVKTLEAFLALPAIVLAYLVAGRGSVRQRVAHLAAAALVLGAVSLPWVLAVDAVPRGERPYISSTSGDSELELLIGYNGLGRLLGGLGVIRVIQGAGAGSSNGLGGLVNPNVANNQQIVSELGYPGPLRLFNQQLAGQLSWLLPLAIAGLVIGSATSREQRLPASAGVGATGSPPQPPSSAAALAPTGEGATTVTSNSMPGHLRSGGLVLWGTWLLCDFIFFTVSVFFHRYYLVTMAPAVAALFGIGLADLWTRLQRGSHWAWLLPACILGDALVQWRLIAPFGGFEPLSRVVLLCASVAVALLAALIVHGSPVPSMPARPPVRVPRWLVRLAMGLGLTSLLLAPAVWAIIPIRDPLTWVTRGSMPYAGPTQPGVFGQVFLPPGAMPSAFFVEQYQRFTAREARYLVAHQGHATFLLATSSALAAAPLALLSNRPVMAFGGFFGTDHILTSGQFAHLVATGTVRYVQVPFVFFGSPRYPGNLPTWVTQHCRPARQAGPGMYDCLTGTL